MIEASADIKKLERKFLPKDLIISNWETIEPYFKELLDREISSAEEFTTLAGRYERTGSSCK